MDTDSLRLFVLAAEKLNISAAGRQLGLASAVASARLAKLEHTLGADLLRRTTRKVTLSLEGAEFLPYTKEMLAQEAAALAVLGRGHPQATGTRRWTTAASSAANWPTTSGCCVPRPDIWSNTACRSTLAISPSTI